MAYLLDACVVSEPKQKIPQPGVLRFLGTLRPADAFLSTITLAEVWKGIELMGASRRRSDLEAWFESDLLLQFDKRILSVDPLVAKTWGTMVAPMIRAGHTMPLLDSLIAATALTHNLTLITRNEKDFAHSGVRIFNPWR